MVSMAALLAAEGTRQPYSVSFMQYDGIMTINWFGDVRLLHTRTGADPNCNAVGTQEAQPSRQAVSSSTIVFPGLTYYSA